MISCYIIRNLIRFEHGGMSGDAYERADSLGYRLAHSRYSVEKMPTLVRHRELLAEGHRIALLCLPFRIGFRFSHIACSYALRCAGLRTSRDRPS